MVRKVNKMEFSHLSYCQHNWSKIKKTLFYFLIRRLKINGEDGEDVFILVPSGCSAVTDSGVVIGEVNSCS